MSERGWSEDRLHQWLAQQAWPARLAGSRGHDAAVLEALDGLPVVCTDQCIESVHFEAGADPAQVGGKAVLRTLSDLAAAAAEPRGVLLAVRAPVEMQEQHLRAALTGAQAAAARHGAEVVGGDLACAPGPWSLAVSAVGSFTAQGPPPGRDRALVGQRLAVSGPVGGSLFAGRHLAPVPRFDAAREALSGGVSAMMDVSDGLAWDAFRLARASGVALEIYEDAVPLHGDAHGAAERSGRSALDHGLGDGEDHELIGTFPDRGLPVGWVEIGRVASGAGLTLVASRVAGAPRRAFTPGSGGWRHGGTS